MEVLYNLRAEHGRRVTAAGVAALLASAGVLACARVGDRSDATADSAVRQSTQRSSDGSGATTRVVPDTSGPVTSFVLIADSIVGGRLYRGSGKCVACHGVDGFGIDGLGPSLRDTVWVDGDGSMAFQQRVIRDGVARPKLGRTVMPSFAATLGTTEIFRIAAYVYTLSHPGATVADTARVDTARVAHPVRVGVLPH